MKKSYFLKKKISVSSKGFGVALLKMLVRFYKFVFAKRTILFVTNQKIRSVTLGPLMQVAIMFSIAFVVSLFNQTLHYNEALSAKSEEINRLKSANKYFEEEFKVVNEKLKKVNEYLILVTGSNHNVSAEEQIIKEPKSFKQEGLSKSDKHTLNELRDVDSQLNNIQSIARVRIKKIENAIALTGLNIKKIPPQILRKKSYQAPKEISLNDEKDKVYGQGGPLVSDASLDAALAPSLSADDLERHLAKVKFSGEFDYLMVLEQLAKIMPLSKPMKNYYISSGFGSRRDPITGGRALHQGLDFVGVNKEKIISPSSGKVILAGRFSDYGNAIVIDHGFGITTRYGHLSEVKVKNGQFVKKGDVIALQGNTGRSTGSHLHYEVRYKNIPLNPKKFIEAGEALFNDGKLIRYANS